MSLSKDLLLYNKYKDEKIYGELFHEIDEITGLWKKDINGNYIYTEEWINNHDISSKENPYLVAKFEDIKSGIETNGAYITLDIFEFERLAELSTISEDYYCEVNDNNGIKEYIINFSKIKDARPGFKFMCNNFDGRGLSLLNYYCVDKYLFSLPDNNSFTRKISNTNFINFYINASSIDGYVFYAIPSGDYYHTNYVNCLFENCKFSGVLYAENSYISDVRYGSFNFNSCNININSIKPLYTNDGLFKNTTFYNCNIYIDFLHELKIMYNSQKCLVFNECNFYNNIIKIIFNGNIKEYTDDESVYYIYNNCFFKNCILDFDLYDETTILPNHLCLINDGQKGVSNLDGIRTDENFMSDVEAKLPLTNDDKFLTTSFLVTDNLYKFENENDYNNEKAKAYYFANNYDDSYGTHIHMRDWIEPFVNYCNSEGITSIELETVFSEPHYYHFSYQNFIIIKLDWSGGIWEGWASRYGRFVRTNHETTYELVQCEKKDLINQVYLLKSYFPLMYDIDDMMNMER